jgi:hypothetical protein
LVRVGGTVGVFGIEGDRLIELKKLMELDKVCDVE